MTEAERSRLLTQIKEENRKGKLKSFMILIVSIILTILVISVLGWVWGENIKRFLD